VFHTNNMTDWSVIVNLNPKSICHMGVTGVGETRFALLASMILPVANGASYPTHAVVSGTMRLLHVIAVDVH
jgi:hypothetical protein